MKRKKTIIYQGLGFPIMIENAETMTYGDEVLPKVNHPRLEMKVFKALITAPFTITGNQLLFIRGFMKKTQAEFAKDLGLKTHSMISTWEKTGNEPTGMSSATELAVRMYMANHLDKVQIVSGMFQDILRGLPKSDGKPIKVAA